MGVSVMVGGMRVGVLRNEGDGESGAGMVQSELNTTGAEPIRGLRSCFMFRLDLLTTHMLCVRVCICLGSVCYFFSQLIQQTREHRWALCAR